MRDHFIHKAIIQRSWRHSTARLQSFHRIPSSSQGGQREPWRLQITESISAADGEKWQSDKETEKKNMTERAHANLAAIDTLPR